MKIVTEELWPGHWATKIIVKRWFRIYKYFNLVCARAIYRHEYLIDTE